MNRLLFLMVAFLWVMGRTMSFGYENDCGNPGPDHPPDCPPCCEEMEGDSDEGEEDGENTGSGEGEDEDGGGTKQMPFSNHVNVQRGNVLRQIADMSAGNKGGLDFTRQFSSRHRDFTASKWDFGGNATWQHNWNFELRESSGTANGFNHMIVRYPEGREYYFQAIDWSGSVRVPDASWGDRLYPWSGAQQGFTMVTPQGKQYDFKKVGSNKYNLTQVRDGLGSYWDLNYDANNRLMKVQNQFGRWIQINRQQLYNNYWCITSVSSSDGRVTQYQYGLWSATGHPVLTNVVYPGGENAVYTYVGRYGINSGLPLLATAKDPIYRGPSALVKYAYNYNATSPPPYGLTVGVMLEQRHLLTDKLRVSLPLGGGSYPQVLEGNGTEITRKYEKGLIKELGDGENRKKIYTRTANGYGYIASVTLPNGATTYYGRDYAGRVLFETNTFGAVKSYTYNTLGFLLTKTDELGRITLYQRNNANQVTNKVYPDGTHEEWTYNSYGQTLIHQFRNGGVESFTYYSTNQVGGSLGDLKTHTDALGATTTYTHDAAGNIISATDALGRITTYQYDLRGNVTKVTHPDNTTRKYGYNLFGKRIRQTNELGAVTKWDYDEYNRVSSVTDPLNRTTQYEYGLEPGCGSCNYKPTLTKITYPSGKQIEYDYDKSGLRTSRTVGAGTPEAATTQYHYDAAGQLDQVTQPGSGDWHYQQDRLNRCTNRIDALGRVTRWTYDAVGNELSEQRPDGTKTWFTYDAIDRLTNITDALGQTTRLSYDANDRLSSLTDARTNTYLYTYNFRGRIRSLQYPDGSQERYGYNVIGNLIAYTNRAGQQLSCNYDNRNRRIYSDWNDATPDIARSYDAADRLLLLSNRASIVSYNYDLANQLTNETQTVSGSGTSKNLSYTYNNDGLRSSLTYPNTAIGLTYHYTARNQLWEIDLNGDYLVNYYYNLNGYRDTKLIADNQVTYYNYDPANQLSDVIYDDWNGHTPSLHYDYDLVGNRTASFKDYMANDEYGYDLIGQLTSVDSWQSPVGLPNYQTSYQYDPVGNRKTVTGNGNATTYSVNNLNQYQGWQLNQFTYDANGNLNKKYAWRYTYDAQNRLIAASNGVTQVTFTYDAKNRCVQRVIDGVTNYLYYDKWELIEERSGNGALMANYIYGTRIDETICRITPTNTLYYVHDGLGNVIQLNNELGQVVERYGYDAFGAPFILNSSNQLISTSAYGNRFLFTGREYLQELGLYDYRNRIYSPEWGRFLQTDPIGFKARDVNLYRYCGNDPINWIDPLGLDITLVNDTEAAGGWGHSGAIVGPGTDDKYTYHSYGPDKNNKPYGEGHYTEKSFDSYEEAKKYAKEQGYDRYARYEADPDQDEAARKKAREYKKQKYNAGSNNCQDMVNDMMGEGDAPFIGNGLPNRSYDDNTETSNKHGKL